MRRRHLLPVLLATAGLALTATPASAASGSLTDPRGDYPDILKLAYSNAASQVQMAMTYASIADAQNESFYLAWGTAGARYQVFNSPSAGLRELRYYARTGAPTQTVPCAGLKVVRRTELNRRTVTIPRSCLPKAAARLRFQGIATAGLSSIDSTKYSPLVARG
ncbi:MAG TPA: hypothetical protein VFR07_18925 [Mycobacteriales bacterium]|nr:hypothetical protein [Mycobacteriales bacterium]